MTDIPRGLLLSGRTEMAAELVIYLPAEEALRLSASIATALCDGEEDPVCVVVEMVGPYVEERSFEERALAIGRTVAAWTRATSDERRSWPKKFAVKS